MALYLLCCFLFVCLLCGAGQAEDRSCIISFYTENGCLLLLKTILMRAVRVTQKHKVVGMPENQNDEPKGAKMLCTAEVNCGVGTNNLCE